MPVHSVPIALFWEWPVVMVVTVAMVALPVLPVYQTQYNQTPALADKAAMPAMAEMPVPLAWVCSPSIIAIYSSYPV